MSWLETIRISGGGAGIEAVLKNLERELPSVPDLKWDICRNSYVPEDVLIVLRWQENLPPPWESNIALTLTRELKKHGLVDHTAWMNWVEDK